MFFDGGYTYSNFLMNVIAIFAFVVWFWLLVVIFGDLVRRHDISGWGKALWVIGLVLFSYLGILAYLITQGRGMAERNVQQAQQARGRTAPCGRLQRGRRDHQARPATQIRFYNRRRIQASSSQTGLTYCM